MGGLILSLTNADEWLLHAVLLRRRRFADVLMRAITHLGDPPIVIAIPLLLMLGLVPRHRATGALAAWALAVSHLGVQLLKRTVVRPRPQLPTGLSFLIEPQDRFSFPSGHAAAGLSVGLPMFLALSGPAAFLCLGVGLTVGLSRCYLGVHYPSDVLMGWSLAALSVLGAGVMIPAAL